MTYQLSLHAAERSRQRGVPERLIALVMDHHDIEFDTYNDCRLLRLSRKMAEAVAIFEQAPSDASRLATLALIYSDRTGRVVTVLRDHVGRSGGRYRRSTK